MVDDKEKDKIIYKKVRDVGITSEHVIAYSFQYEFERSLAMIRAENDPASTRNGLFDVITDLAGFILQNKGDDDDIKKKVTDEIEKLDSDVLSPKTTMNYVHGDKRYKLTYDSYQVECNPSELPVSMEQLNREREEVTIRNLWAMLGRLKAIAYENNLFKANFIVDRSEIS